MEENEKWLRIQGVKSLTAAQKSSIVTDQLSGTGSLLDCLKSNELTKKQHTEFLSPDKALFSCTLKWIADPEHHFIPYSSEYYPENLRHIASPPLFLFLLGDISLLKKRQIAIVGSRRSSLYGDSWAHHFSAYLAAAGFVITSGLALGIDGQSHRGALEKNGKTLAVLGAGLATIYPRTHRHLAKQIIENGGALVSEFLIDQPPIARHFPQRNRIISGLSQAVLVIEASLRSGSLITAKYALEQGKDIFALPGAVGNPLSEGGHQLIQQGATLVTTPEQIASHLNGDLQWLLPLESELINTPQKRVDPPALLDPALMLVLEAVNDTVTPLDEIANRCEQSIPLLTLSLLELEMQSYIVAVQGGYIRRS